MRPRLPLLAPALALSLLSLSLSLSPLACSGQVFVEGTPNPHGDDTGDASPDGAPPPGYDSGPSPPATGPCPTSAPPLGSTCSDEDLQCEYGQSEYPGCDNLVQCTSGTWQGEVQGELCPPPNSTACPPTMAAAEGSSCDPGPNGAQSCFYPTGGCYCGSLGGPTPIEADGGFPPQTWQCDDPGPNCPFPRPRIGTHCTDEGVSCQYLECAFAQTCTDGLWTFQPEGCAIAGTGSSGP